MAIVIEEEKKASGAPALLGYIVFFVVVAAAVYYVFFAAPPAAVAKPPANLTLLTQLGSANFDPSSVLNNPSFQALKTYVAEPTSTGPVAIGRKNPFIAP